MAELTREYYPDNTIKSEVFEINGQREGEYKEYYNQEELKSLYDYNPDKYNNPQIYIICNYVNGQLEGEYKQYRINGQLYEIRNYVNGVYIPRY